MVNKFYSAVQSHAMYNELKNMRLPGFNGGAFKGAAVGSAALGIGGAMISRHIARKKAELLGHEKYSPEYNRMVLDATKKGALIGGALGGIGGAIISKPRQNKN